MKKTKTLKLAALLLAVIMLLPAVTGCSDKTKAVALINGKELSAQDFEYYLKTSYNSYSSQGYTFTGYWNADILGDGSYTPVDLITEDALQNAAYYQAIYSKCDELGQGYSKDDEKACEDSFLELAETYGSAITLQNTLKANNTTKYDLLKSSADETMKARLYDILTGEGGELYQSDDELRQEVNDNYICVKHILISTADVEEEEIDEMRATAEDILEQAKSGEDFESLMENHSDDTSGMESYPNGYVFAEDDTTYDADFVAASFKLDVNEISDIVETDYGFHIIKRYELSDDQITEQMTAIPTANFAEYVTAISSEYEIEQLDTFSKLDIVAIVDPTDTTDYSAIDETEAEDTNTDADTEGTEDAEGEGVDVEDAGEADDGSAETEGADADETTGD